MANLPIDESGMGIPALGLKDGGAQKVNIEATANRSSELTGDINDIVHSARIISLYATTPCYIKIGDSSVEATDTDHYYPSGLYYDLSLKKSQTHISVLRVGATDGILYISEKD